MLPNVSGGSMNPQYQISRTTIVETMNLAPFTMHKEIHQFALTHELEDVATGASIRDRINNITEYLIKHTTSVILVKEVITDLINQELKKVQWASEYSDESESFQVKYPKLYESLRKDGFTIVDYQLLRDNGLIESPGLIYNFKFVEECLDQCQTLISNHSLGSAVDRAHTALHGYMKEICTAFELEVLGSHPKIQDYWSEIKLHHPKFNVDVKEYHTPINQVVGTIGKVIDKINDLRNNKTYSHPNDEILGEGEARLVINLSRVFLQYIDGKVSSD